MKRAKLKFLIRRLLREQNVLDPLPVRKPEIEEPSIDPPIDPIGDKSLDDTTLTPLMGCMDEGALNFNPNAIIPCDECCQYV